MAEANLLIAARNNKLERRNSSAENLIAKTNNLIGNIPDIPSSLSLDYSCHGDSLGASSPVKISTPKIKEKVIPHYLRASSGSCHDFCKYGRKIGDEPKPWHSLPKRMGKPTMDLFVSNKSPVSVERKKVMTAKHIHGNNVESPQVSKHLSGILRRRYSTSADGLFVEQPKLVSMKSAPLDGSEGKLGRGRRNSINNDKKNPEDSKPSLKKLFADRTRNLLKLAPSTKDQNSNQNAPSTKPKNEKISLKKLSFIKKVTAGNFGDSNVKINNVVEYDPKDVEEDNDNNALFMTNKTAKKKNGKDIMKGNQAMSLRKGIAALSKHRNYSVKETKFQRGRTVELQSLNCSPRKLKFIRRKIPPANQDGKPDVTEQLKKKAIANKVRLSPKPRKVVLRHRAMNDKKDAQGLFNNVIEETASKLVKSRKSKVKALVGAFETVISLQDSKHSKIVDNLRVVSVS